MNLIIFNMVAAKGLASHSPPALSGDSLSFVTFCLRKTPSRVQVPLGVRFVLSTRLYEFDYF